MIDLEDYALVSDAHATVVSICHLPCGDQHAVITMDDALQWAGDHVCGA